MQKAASSFPTDAGCYTFSGIAPRASLSSPSASAVPVIASVDLVGEWLSLVEHLVRDQGVGGSNPLSPTNFFKQFYRTHLSALVACPHRCPHRLEDTPLAFGASLRLQYENTAKGFGLVVGTKLGTVGWEPPM